MPGAARVRRVLPTLSEQVARVPDRTPAVRGRPCVVRWYLEHGRRARATADRFGWSTATLYLWLRRYERDGVAGLADRSRAPHTRRQPTWTVELAAAVRDVRTAHPRWGKDKIVVILRGAGWQVSTSMVGRILHQLKEAGALQDARLRDPCIVRRPQPRPYAVRKPKSYLPSAPGDLV